jgi:hypothetical protein
LFVSGLDDQPMVVSLMFKLIWGSFLFAAIFVVTPITTYAGALSVSLSAVANVQAFVSNGTAPSGGGLDSSDYTYSANLLGTSVTFGGSTFTFGAAGALDAVSNTTIPLPAGNYTTLNLLGTAVHGAQTNQSFIVTYTDGTTTTITQSLSDWWGPPQNFTGESQVAKMASLVSPSGAAQNETVYVYGYSLGVNSAKTVQSLTLPANRYVIILAIDATPPITGSGTVNPGTAGQVAYYSGTGAVVSGESLSALQASLTAANAQLVTDSPAAVVSDYSPANYGATTAVLYLTPASGGTTLNGLAAGSPMQQVFIVNAEVAGGADAISLVNQSTADSTAANRFLTSSKSLTIPPGGRAGCIYLASTVNRWNCQ